MLGSITANLMGESQSTHCGPWFCWSSIRYPLVGQLRFDAYAGARNADDIHFIEWVSMTTLST
jgi:hypothetical protein